MNTDLFPETLLVSREGDRIFTTSLKVAEHFKKRHGDVLRAIEKLIADIESDDAILRCQIDISRLNFEPSEYANERGKTYPTYKLGHDAFAILAMGFTGKEALIWKIRFIAAFNTMEAQLRAQAEREARALHQLRPVLGPVIAGTEQGLSRAQIGASVNRSLSSITRWRRAARRLGLLPDTAQRAGESA